MSNPEQYMIPCPMKTITGIPCPGCGVQRAILEMLNGNILVGIKAYPPLIPVLIMIIFLFLHIKYDFKNGALFLKISFFINAVIIILNYIYNLLI